PVTVLSWRYSQEDRWCAADDDSRRVFPSKCELPRTMSAILTRFPVDDHTCCKVTTWSDCWEFTLSAFEVARSLVRSSLSALAGFGSHKINIYSPIKREDRAYTRLRLRVSRLHGDYYKPVNCPQWVIAAYKNPLIINRDSLLMPPSGIAPVVRLHVFKFLRDTGYLDKI
ncbi:hypothetical protein DPMN_011613, partial [Dreissena polymorpha]